MMLENFLKLTTTDDFKGMSETALKKYIGDKRLKAENADPVFEALVNWVTQDLENRKSGLTV